VFSGAKIVCTLGPSSNTPEIIDQLIRAGMDVARLNFSHGTHDDHRHLFNLVRSASDRAERAVGILADLQGPKIRLQRLEGGKAVLRDNTEFTITTEPCLGTAERASTTYVDFARDVKPGDTVLLNDGLIHLVAISGNATDVVCRVVEGGEISDRKGINLPGVVLSTPALTDKDADDLRFALSLRVDFVALSFVRAHTDISFVHKVMDEVGVRVPVIAKIEKPEAMQNLDRIVETFDAFMVARGDLGVEVPFEDVPAMQRKVIKAANAAAKPVIVATQMLESMIHNSRPTRAEASDVANAVLDGADAVMLSAETGAGEFPVMAVETMRRIIDATAPALVDRQRERRGDREHVANSDASLRERQRLIPPSIAAAADNVAEAVGAKLLVALTETGASARLVSRERSSLPILAFTTRPTTRSELSLSWGVETFITQGTDSTEQLVLQINNELLRLNRCIQGDLVVIIGGTLSGVVGATNTIRVHTVF
jgi:pyruvate kinase